MSFLNMCTISSIRMMLYYTAIVAALSSQILSVVAIRCHQCNSHTEEDCIDLRLSTPHAPRDDQFLKECKLETDAEAFCRKTVLKIDVTGEKRIVRECGWIRDKVQTESGISCFSADNEGYKQTICACDEDGCNGSQSLSVSKRIILGSVVLIGATVIRGY